MTMEFVVDTNIAIAAIIRRGGTRFLMLRPDLELASPQRLLEELEKYEQEMAEKSGLGIENVEKAIALVLSNIRIVKREEYAMHEQRAQALAPDKDDAPFFALALALDYPIWSNEKRLKRQGEVKVYCTGEIASLLPPESA